MKPLWWQLCSRVGLHSPQCAVSEEDLDLLELTEGLQELGPDEAAILEKYISWHHTYFMQASSDLDRHLRSLANIWFACWLAANEATYPLQDAPAPNAPFTWTIQ